MEYIKIDNQLPSPIYKQIIQSIYSAIDKGILKKGDLLPSVNKIATHFSMARGSVFNAYNEMKAAGTIDAKPGKGYYIVNTLIKREQNIFLMFDNFAPYKEIIYNSFVSEIKDHANVDLYFHHHNKEVFESLINQKLLYYNTFIIIPPLYPSAKEVVKSIPKKQLYILDLGYKYFGKKYPSVCQNFEKDIQQILVQSKERLAKYNKFILIISKAHLAKEIITGFIKYCKSEEVEYSVVDNFDNSLVEPGTCFIIINDNDLVELIHAVTQKKIKLGKEVGIISYNETPLKSVIANGITTVSTDFALMGKTMADLVINKRADSIENEFKITLRKSL